MFDSAFFELSSAELAGRGRVYGACRARQNVRCLPGAAVCGACSELRVFAYSLKKIRGRLGEGGV